MNRSNRVRSQAPRKSRRKAVPLDRSLFVHRCIDAPYDHHLKTVFADWCDENDEPLAAVALRWLAKHEKNPVRHFVGDFWYFYVRGIDDYPTLRELKTRRPDRRRRMPYVECWLPQIVGRELSGRYCRSSRDWFVLIRRLGWALQRIRDLVN